MSSYLIVRQKRSAAIHTDRDAGSLQTPGKFAAGELRALIAVENIRSANPQCVFERAQTKADFLNNDE
jgi:hypothetical protein